MDEFIDAFTGGINENRLALEARVEYNKQGNIRDQQVLDRYVRYVESKYKGFFGGLCLRFNDKYQIAMELIERDFERQLNGSL